jgi:hypothetical protein
MPYGPGGGHAGFKDEDESDGEVCLWVARFIDDWIEESGESIDLWDVLNCNDETKDEGVADEYDQAAAAIDGDEGDKHVIGKTLFKSKIKGGDDNSIAVNDDRKLGVADHGRIRIRCTDSGEFNSSSEDESKTADDAETSSTYSNLCSDTLKFEIADPIERNNDYDDKVDV